MNLCIAPQLSVNVTDVHMQVCVCVLSRVVNCVGFVSFAVSLAVVAPRFPIAVVAPRFPIYQLMEMSCQCMGL